MLENLKELFSVYSDAVICERNGKILYMNDPAVELAGADVSGSDISALFPTELFEERDGMFSFSAELNGDDILVTSCPVGDMNVLTAKRREIFTDLSDQIGESIKSSVAISQIALEFIRPHVESIGDPQLSKYAAILSHSNYSISRTASNISRFTNLDNAKKMPFSDITDLVCLCGDICSSVSYFTEKHCARLVFDASVYEAPVYGDSLELEEAVLNLLSNSFKYTPEDGTVTLSLKKAKNKYIITVSDTGCGMKTDVLRTVFRRYAEPRDLSDGKSGLGFGLPIVRFIVSQHGGSILIESREGKGTRVMIILPAADNISRIGDPDKKYLGCGAHHILTVMADVLGNECYSPKYLD